MEHHSSKLKGLAWLVVAISIGIIAAVGLPGFTRMIPWSAERQLGHWIGGISVEGKCRGARHPESAELLNRVVSRLYPIESYDSSLPVSVSVLPGTTVNAFASLGGQIVVYEGLIKQAESADELAGVLAHEIEHVYRRHILEKTLVHLMTSGALTLIFTGGQSTPQLASFFLNMKFSRGQESEADRGGLKRLQDAQVDVTGFQHFFEKLQNSSGLSALLSDHPADTDRAELAAKYKSSVVRPILSKSEWNSLKKICE